MCSAVQQEDGADGRSNVRIISVQPDRDHAFVEVIGECGHEGVAELRQRVDGLLIAGARFVLVDLTGASEVAPTTSAALAAARRQLTRRKGWLRLVGHDPSTSTSRYDASLSDLFTMYQAAAGRRGHDSGR
jgi:anti-anti-sigma regulatory factor